MAQRIGRRAFVGGAGLAAAGFGYATPDSELIVVGISCSPRQGKTTAAALQVCLGESASVSPRIKTELIELAPMSIPAQLAAGVPLREGETDDFPTLVAKLENPAVVGIVIGTPVYFGNMSALCKAFLDRCIAFRKNNFSLSGKVAGVLAVGGSRNGGQELTIQSVLTALMSHQVILVGDGIPTAHWGGTLWNASDDDIRGDEFGLSTAKNLGRRLAETALRLHGK